VGRRSRRKSRARLSSEAFEKVRVAESSPRRGLLGFFRRRREAREAQDREAFANEVQAALHELSAAGRYTYDPASFALVESATGTRSPLADAYARYSGATPEIRRDVIEEIARKAFVTPIPREFALAQAGLTLELRSRALHELERLAHASCDAAVLPVASGLMATLHYDRPGRRHRCTRTNLEEWGRTLEEAFGVALYNLASSAPEHLIEGPPGVYLSPPSHPAGSTLVCAEKLIRSTPLRGDPVVMVPTRSVLLVAGSDDAAGIGAMSDFALRSLRADRPISGTAFRWTDRGWRRYHAADGALMARLRRIEIPIELRELAEQKAILDALHLKARQSLHVATAELTHDGCGNPQTLTCWQEGVGDALLPRTDRLVFVRAGARAERVSVDFTTAFEEVGRCIEATDLYPARFRVTGFPSSDELRALSRRPDCIVEHG
jgi:hypothetical protein